MTGERIVLTGSSGTLGYHLLEQLSALPGAMVLALLRKQSRRPKDYPSVLYGRVDLSDTNALKDLLGRFKPTCVIHCAASGMQFPKPQWFDLIRFNVDVSLNLCECVSYTTGCRFVFVSSGIAYRETARPLRESDALDTAQPYGASKAAADILLRSAASEFGVPLTVVRPFSFTGVGDDGTRLFPTLLRAAAEGRPFDLSPGDQVRDHCAGKDIAAGIMAAAVPRSVTGGQSMIYNFGSGRETTLKPLLEDVCEQLGLDVELRFGTRGYAPFEPMFLVADIARAKRELGWEPRQNLAYAVWELARASFPTLRLKQPKEDF
jgi:UDP-arabinose 4-epimerase